MQLTAVEPAAPNALNMSTLDKIIVEQKLICEKIKKTDNALNVISALIVNITNTINNLSQKIKFLINKVIAIENLQSNVERKTSLGRTRASTNKESLKYNAALRKTSSQ